MTKEQMLQLIIRWFNGINNTGYFENDGDGCCVIDGDYNLNELAEFLINEMSDIPPKEKIRFKTSLSDGKVITKDDPVELPFEMDNITDNELLEAIGWPEL